MPDLRGVRLPASRTELTPLIDRIFTPPALATLLVNGARAVRPKLIADFAAGDGALLRAANYRWPEASFFGSDLDPSVVSAMISLPRKGEALVCDFLNETASEQLSAFKARCDVILLNPPFSARGNKRHHVDLEGRSYSGSKALAFIAHALRFLRRQGELLAIIPSSCLTSERDSALLEAIEKTHRVTPIGELHRGAFDAHAVSVALIKISPRDRPLRRRSTPPLLAVVRPFQVELMRGSLPVHRAVFGEAGVPYVHTSDLRDLDSGALRTVLRSTRAVDGPAVLLPRVGRPDRAKLMLSPAGRLVLSDCVIALRTEPRGHERELFRLMKRNWANIEKLYGGSCAPYLTTNGLLGLMAKIGIRARRVGNMQDHCDGVADAAIEAQLRTA